MFTTGYNILNELFGIDIKYSIPAYQRPYSWDCLGKSDANNQINEFWSDLIEHFNRNDPNPYFMGSMVFIKNDERNYEVVDGQQRLTSIVILFVSIKCFLMNLKSQNNLDENLNTFVEFAVNQIDTMLFNQKLFGMIVKEKKVRIEHHNGFDYDKILKSVMECSDFSQHILINANDEEMEVSLKYFNNRSYFIEKIKENFSNNGFLTFKDAENLNAFIDFLKNKVIVIRILSEKFEMAYQIFEILNNRGLQLSNKDLFRNFLISELYSNYEKHGQLEPKLLVSQKWNQLNENYQFDNEFISRYVESYAAKSQKHSAFNNLKLIYKNFQTQSVSIPKIEAFYNQTEKYLNAYTQIQNCEANNKSIIARLKFLLHTDNQTYIQNVLLTLFVNFPDETDRLNFILSFERYIIFQILATQKRFSINPFFESIQQLNQLNLNKAIAVFDLNEDEKKQLSLVFSNDIKDNEIAKLLLARYFWIFQSQNTDVGYFELNYSSATLEHVMPQVPLKETNWLSDFTSSDRNNWTYKLANMTLLTHKMNSKLSNSDFSIKKEKGYKNSTFPLTLELSKTDKIDVAFYEERQKKIVKGLKDSFGI